MTSQRTSPCVVHAHRLAVFGDDAGDLDALNHLHAAVARALGQRHAQIRRVGLAVARQPDRTLQIVGAHDGVFVAGFLRRYLVAFDAETVGHGDLFLQHLHALRRARHIDAAALLPACGQACLGFQRGIELDAVLAHLRHVAVGPHLADQACGMPGGAAGEFSLLQQQHVGLAHFGQVISHRAAGDAAAHDDDLCVAGECHGAHGADLTSKKQMRH
jgi:hypothetical protein